MRATLQAAVLRGDGPHAALAASTRRCGGAARSSSARRSTAACGAADGGVEVRLLAAGHPPPLVLRAEGALEERRRRRARCSASRPSRASASASVRLEPGDALLLYTDGATELRGDDPWRGEQALRETLRAARRLHAPAELVERVEHEALVLSGGELRDDLALLAVARRRRTSQ